MDKNNKLIFKYLALCFGITYIAWGIVACYSRINKVNFNEYNWMIFLYTLGVISPAISAIYMQKKIENKKWKEIFYNIIKLPSCKIDWLIVLLIVSITQVLPYFIFGGKIIGSFINLIIYIPMFIIIGGLEEIGWRGFYLEKELEKEHKNKTISVLTIGIVWEIWHMPLFLMLGTYQQVYSNVLLHLVSTLSIAFLLGAVYIKSHSILLCMFMHSLINSLSDIIVIKQGILEQIVILAISLVFFQIVYNFAKKENNFTNI